MPERPDLRVSETDQPDDEGVQHVLIIENTVLALEDDIVDKINKITLKEEKKKNIHQVYTMPLMQHLASIVSIIIFTLNFFCAGPATISGYSPLSYISKFK